MHICFLMPQIEYYSPISGGAVATVNMELARELIAMGHQLTVLSPDRGDPLYDVGTAMRLAAPRREDIGPMRRIVYKIRGKINHWDMPYYPPYMNSFTAALRQLSPRPDWIVIANDLTSPRYVRAACPDAKILVHLHNEQRTRQRSTAAFDSYVDHYLAVSGYIRDWTVRQYGFPAEKISVLLNGVNTETFHPRPNYIEPRAPIRVIFVGRINHDKGPDIAADAVAALRREGIPIELTVAGGTWFYGHNQQDPYLQSLLKKIDAAGGKYLGHVVRSDIPELLRQHDVALIPSRWNDPCPLTISESMASGLAVIASNCGGIPEACGGAARLVNPDDFKAVVDTLRELATNPKALAEEKANSVTRAAECTWRRRAEDVLATLRPVGDLCPRSQGPGLGGEIQNSGKAPASDLVRGCPPVYPLDNRHCVDEIQPFFGSYGPLLSLLRLRRRLRGNIPLRLWRALAGLHRVSRPLFLGRTWDNIKFVGDFSDEYSIIWNTGDHYDKGLLVALKRAVESRVGLFIDVGGNLGIVAATAGRALAGRGEVLCLEADPVLARYAAATAELNALTNVRIFAAAASDHDGIISFGRSIGNSALGSVGKKQKHKRFDMIDIPCTRIDTLLRVAGGGAAVSLIKIDVEGHELAVLRGGGSNNCVAPPSPAIRIQSSLRGERGMELGRCLQGDTRARCISVLGNRGGSSCD